MKTIDRFIFRFAANPIWAKVLRIGTPTLLLASLLLLWKDFPSLYGAARFVDAPLLALKQDTIALSLGPVSQEIALMAYAMLCMTMMADFWPRISAVLLLILHQSIFIGHTLFSYGFDYLACNALCYAALIPTAKLYNPWHSPMLRVIQLHLCVIYFVAGINKAFGSTWWDGEALWKAVVQPGYTQAVAASLAQQIHRQWWVVGGWLVVALEVSYPFFIWLPQTRKLWLWATVVLHIGIALVMGLYFFSALMILFNVAAFHYPYLPFTKQFQTSISPMVHPLRPATKGSETPAQVARVEPKAPKDV